MQSKTKDFERRQRLRKNAVKYALILCIAIGYLLFVLQTGIGIPCIFYKITGFQCPGCGVSRMLTALSKFDFAAAFWYNPFLFITGPLILFFFACGEIKYVWTGSRNLGKWEVIIWAEAILAVAFGIARNFLPI